jgi:hypothetical protein
MNQSKSLGEFLAKGQGYQLTLPVTLSQTACAEEQLTKDLLSVNQRPEISKDAVRGEEAREELFQETYLYSFYLEVPAYGSRTFPSFSLRIP